MAVIRLLIVIAVGLGAASCGDGGNLYVPGGCPAAGCPTAPPSSEASRPSPTVALPPLPYGIYGGDIVKVDVANRVMTYRVTQACAPPSAGVFLLPLDRATFWVHRDPAPERGSTDEFSFVDWVGVTRQFKTWEVHYSADALTVGNGPSPWCDGG